VSRATAERSEVLSATKGEGLLLEIGSLAGLHGEREAESKVRRNGKIKILWKSLWGKVEKFTISRWPARILLASRASDHKIQSPERPREVPNACEGRVPQLRDDEGHESAQSALIEPKGIGKIGQHRKKTHDNYLQRF